jgi:hypothetical protein
MQAIELETIISLSGDVRIPEEYKGIYGKNARIIILMRDEMPSKETPGEDILSELLGKTSGVWAQGDGLEYQMKIRNEWERDWKVAE